MFHLSVGPTCSHTGGSQCDLMWVGPINSFSILNALGFLIGKILSPLLSYPVIKEKMFSNLVRYTILPLWRIHL